MKCASNCQRSNASTLWGKLCQGIEITGSNYLAAAIVICGNQT
jgi:hypothetical protein